MTRLNPVEAKTTAPGWYTHTLQRQKKATARITRLPPRLPPAKKRRRAELGRRREIHKSHSPKRLETRTSRTQTLQTQTHSTQTRTHLQPKTRTHLPKGPAGERPVRGYLLVMAEQAVIKQAAQKGFRRAIVAISSSVRAGHQAVARGGAAAITDRATPRRSRRTTRCRRSTKPPPPRTTSRSKRRTTPPANARSNHCTNTSSSTSNGITTTSGWLGTVSSTRRTWRPSPRSSSRRRPRSRPGLSSWAPPQPKPPAAQVQAGVAHAWPPAVHTPGAPGGDWFQRTGRDVNVLRGQEVTQVIGGHPAGAHHHMAGRAHGHTQAHGYHFPVPQPPGAMFPHPSFPESRSQGPAPTGYLGIYPKSPAGDGSHARRSQHGQQTDDERATRRF